MNDTASSSRAARIVCPATRDTGTRLLIVTAMLLGCGIWCMTDQKPYKTFSEDLNGWASWATNFYGAIVCPIAALVIAAFAIRSLRRKLIADADGIGYVGKSQIPWSDVKGLDVSDFASKQILLLKLGGQDKKGKEKTFKLDGYDLQNFKELVALVETKVPTAGA